MSRYKHAGQNYSYLYDGKGNVTALLDGSQAVAATYTYDAFGSLMSQTGSLSQPFKFSTKMYDEQTGLSYFGYRFYSPIVGRWLTRDPIGYAGGLNLYGFVGNNPVNGIDPLGLVELILVGRKPPTPENPYIGPDYHSEYALEYAGDRYPNEVKIIQVRDFSDFQRALKDHENITNLTYMGDGNDTRYSEINPWNSPIVFDDVKCLDTSNMAPGAQIVLDACNSASRSRKGNPSMAEAFRDHFNRDTTGWTGYISFWGWPVSGPLPYPHIPPARRKTFYAK